jgi:hypothetical protein
MNKENILVYPGIAIKQYTLLIEELVKNNINKNFILIRNSKSECNKGEISFEEMLEYNTDYSLNNLNERNLFFSLREICAANRLLAGDNEKIKIFYITLHHTLKKHIIGNNIKKIISYSLSDGLTMSLYNVAKEIGIDFNYLINTRIQEGIMNSTRADTGPHNFENKLKINKKIIIENKNLYIEYMDKLNEYNQSRVQPKYASDKKLSSQKFLDINIKNLLNKALESIKPKNKKFKEVGFYELVWKRVSRAIQIKFYHKNIKINNSEDLNGLKYFVFPLHYHPESSTLINGRWLHDQIKIIQIIVANLPAEYKLIVKEHKIAIGRRPLHYYYNILKIADVMLANENLYIGDLISSSKGLITISGTAGLEAYLAGKKIGVIGDVYYMHAPGVTTVHDISKMRENLYQIIDGKGIEDVDRVALYKTLIEEGEIIDNFLPTNVDKRTIQGMMNLLARC